MALPLLVLDNIARADTSVVTKPQTIATVSDSAAAPPPVPSAPPAAAVLDTTTSTTVPTTAPPTTTTTEPPTTTTTEPVPAPEPEPGNEQTGGASWYHYRSGECAHRSIPKGTSVTVTNLGNGATTSCVVTDRGPFSGGRIIDLDDGTFSEIASTGQGVVLVSITW